MRITLLFILFFNYLATFKAAGQNPNYLFNQLTLQHGLSEGTIRNIMEDKDGYMWFGTEDGLNKFNGYEFVVYKRSFSDHYSISDNRPKTLFLDAKSRLWITTFRGVNLYDPIQDKFYNFNSTDYPALRSLDKDIESMLQTKDGHFWFCDKYGLYEVSSLYHASSHYSQKFSSHPLFLKMKVTSDGWMWIGCRDGLCKFDMKKKVFYDLRKKYGSGYQVNDIVEKEDGTLWIATNKGVKVINEQKGIFEEIIHQENNPFSIIGNNIVKIVKANDGNYLFAVDGSGLDYLNVQQNKFYHYSQESDCQLNCNNITTLYIDSKNDLWVGTFLNGINYSNPSISLFHFINNNRYSEKRIRKGIVTSFLKDKKENLWFATDGGGIFLKKKGKEKYQQFLQENAPGVLTSNIALHLVGDSNNIWITTYDGGLNQYNYAKGKFQSYMYRQNDTTGLSTNKLGPAIVKDGKLWISTDSKGIDVLDPVNGKFKRYRVAQDDPYSLPSEWVTNFLIDHKGVLWITTINGLCRYVAEKDKFQTYSFEGKEKIALRNSASDLVEDEEGNLWLGTNGGGLIKFHPETRKFEVFTTANGLSNDNIRIIIQDDFHNLWLGTNNGVTKFNIRTNICKAYSVKDGVPPNAFYPRAKYKDEKGNIYFGASGGYLVINPSSARINRKIPPVVLTELKVDNHVIKPHPHGTIEQSIGYAKEIHLSYPNNSITFEFASLNYNNQEKNRYSYYLKGFDHKWSPTSGQRSATYTNLDPGTYTFLVKGSNNDGVWNNKPKAVTIDIPAPFYLTSWFKIVEGCLGMVFLFTFVRWRIENIKSKNKELERVIENRTKELKESNTQLEAFVYKASHDIRGPLKSVIGITTIGINDFQGNDAAISYFEHILKSTKKLDKLLSELLELTKVKQTAIRKEVIEVEEMIRSAVASFEHHHNFQMIDIHVNVKKQSEMRSDKNLLGSVIQNLIENPIKYLDKEKQKPFLHIDVLITEKEAKLVFKDNGPGIPAEYKEKIFDMFYKVNAASDGTGLGLYIVKTSVEKLGGKIQLQSEIGKGSTFCVLLPV